MVACLSGNTRDYLQIVLVHCIAYGFFCLFLDLFQKNLCQTFQIFSGLKLKLKLKKYLSFYSQSKELRSSGLLQLT